MRLPPFGASAWREDLASPDAEEGTAERVAAVLLKGVLGVRCGLAPTRIVAGPEEDLGLSRAKNQSASRHAASVISSWAYRSSATQTFARSGCGLIAPSSEATHGQTTSADTSAAAVSGVLAPSR